MVQILKSLLVGTLPGIVIAGVSYYMFTARPDNQLEAVSISYTEILIPVGIMSEFALSMSPKSKAEEIITNQYEYFSNHSNFSVRTYTLRNNGTRIAQDISVILKPFKRAVIDENKDKKYLTPSETSNKLTILPGEKVTLTVLYTGAFRIDDSDKFLLNGEAIPIRNPVEFTYQDPISEFTIANPGLTALVWLSAIFTLGIAIFIAVAKAYLTGRPNLWAAAADSERLIQSLVAINYLKVENPEKYSKIVARACKLHKRWVDNPEEARPKQDAS
ncbi:hypothetical protein FY136_10350 [Agrobacterium tumefaciens]|uniref:hypothetical protein n=1 Tax=Agrobacterium tumefaciens TaxID=358 RepID=UPI0021D2FCD2|nr:hypothetical protein [Agrobacterium tumefaciens]UXT49617.1 hypothetical protein FY136_10350 [Agrobacterium tumefaciens]